jgi:hypothetical protein
MYTPRKPPHKQKQNLTASKQDQTASEKAKLKSMDFSHVLNKAKNGF